MKKAKHTWTGCPPSAVCPPSPLCCDYSCLKPCIWVRTVTRSRLLWHGLSHLEAIVFLSTQQLLLKREETWFAHTHTPLPGLAPAFLLTVRGTTEKSRNYSHKVFINAACSSHLSDTEVSDQKYETQTSTFFLLTFLHNALFTTLQSFSSLRWAFDLNHLSLLSSVYNALTIFLFKDIPLCICSNSATKPTGLSQLVTTKNRD